MTALKDGLRTTGQEAAAVKPQAETSPPKTTEHYVAQGLQHSAGGTKRDLRRKK